MIKKILILLIILSLPAKLCQAFEVPFSSKNANIIFEDKTYEKQLLSLIEDSLKISHQEREDQKIVLDNEQIALLDKNLIEKILYSQGFYDGKVEYQIGELKEKNTYQINPKEPYLIKAITIKSDIVSIKLPSDKEFIKQLGLENNKILLADNVLLAQKKLSNYVEENYCLWQVQIDYQAIINRQTKKAEIIFTLKNSNQVKFGEVHFTGLETIEESYIKNKIQITQNSCFKKSIIDKAKLDLLKTGLFADISANLEKTPKQFVNVNFIVKERHNKTVKAGIAFNSNEGLVLSTGFEHRNILAKAQTLQVDLRASRLSQIINSSLTIPSFFNPKQNLIINEELARKTFDSFDANSSSSSITLKRKLTKSTTAGIGGELKISHVKDNIKTEDFRLLSIPLTLEYDKRNQEFNPDSGLFAAARTAPYIDLVNNNEYFTKSTAISTYYYKANNWFLKPVFALKLSAGSINHIKQSDAPADEKFFIGGSNSVRGYAFQKGGIIFNGDPVGGLSFIENSIEARLRFSQNLVKNFGMAFFIDGGNNFVESKPDLTQNLKWSGGFGVRYFTEFLPIRVDIAFPFDKRSKIDSSFQLYIGIGQAF